MYGVQSSKSFLVGHRHIEIIGSSKEWNKISNNISDRTYTKARFGLDSILRVCQSLWDSFLYLGKLHWFLYLLLSYFYDPGMSIFRWSSNFVEKVVLNESMSAKRASHVSYLVYYYCR